MTTEELTPEVQSLAAQLAQGLIGHPNAQRGLENSFTRIKENRLARQAPVLKHCPYCGTEGAPMPVGEFQYSRRRDDCCQQALFEAARAALTYSTNPRNPVRYAQEQARFYLVLKTRLTDPALRRELVTLESLLTTGKSDRSAS